LKSQGFTLSFGVAIAHANYPFYLLRDLAEDLLKSAKKAGSSDPGRDDLRAPAYVDFHMVTSASSLDVDAIRERDYLTDTRYRRTLRPFPVETLDDFRHASSKLRTCNPALPRSKLNDLFEAALIPSAPHSERTARELFSRCEPAQREALWEAMECLGTIARFPWCEAKPSAKAGTGYATALADLVEVADLMQEES
jgi:hypothetical protein